MPVKLVDAPMALTSGGEIILNVTHFDSQEIDPKVLVEIAARLGRPIFVGVAVLRHEIPEVLSRVDDALAEIASTVTQRDRG